MSTFENKNYIIKRAIKFPVFRYRLIFYSNKSISTDFADWSNGGNPIGGHASHSPIWIDFKIHLLNQLYQYFALGYKTVSPSRFLWSVRTFSAQKSEKKRKIGIGRHCRPLVCMSYFTTKLSLMEEPESSKWQRIPRSYHKFRSEIKNNLLRGHQRNSKFDM
jgi:hypothetical protein